MLPETTHFRPKFFQFKATLFASVRRKLGMGAAVPEESRPGDTVVDLGKSAGYETFLVVFLISSSTKRLRVASQKSRPSAN